jgi:hypothetical protein
MSHPIIDMQVQETSGEFWAVKPDGSYIAGPFPTNAAAWSWVDRHSEGDDGTDAYNRHPAGFQWKL